MKSHDRRSWSLSALILAAFFASDASRQARGADLAIHWRVREGTEHSRIEVTGFDSVDLRALDALTHAPNASFVWPEVFKVWVEAEGADPAREVLPILGTYQVKGDRLVFEPRFPIEPGLKHRALVRPSRLPGETFRGWKDVSSEWTKPAPTTEPTATIERVDPVSDHLPENLLKFYLHFSSPMSRGEAYNRVHLLDATGKKLVVPFLELGEELWDPSGTRLTLLLDPGRIKQGLKPREDLGPILNAGQSYTLVVDREWPDALGQRMKSGYRKTFQAIKEDHEQPNPSNWKVTAPKAGSSDPLVVEFPEPLDRAMLNRTLVVLDSRGDEVQGRLAVDPRATQWSFFPEQKWRTGHYQVQVDSTLEDLAGNSVARPFEVDVLHPITKQKPLAKQVTIPWEVR